MYNVKAYRLVQVDARGPWEHNPQSTIIGVSGDEWLAESFALVIRAFDTAEDVEGVTVTVQYQDQRERWWDMDRDEVNEFLDNV